MAYLRHCEERKRRSNPASLSWQRKLDCFASLAMTAENSAPSNRLATRLQRRVADRGDVGLVGLHRAALEHGGACHQRVGAGGGELAGNVGADAAVNLDVDRAARGHRAEVPDLAE